MRKYFINYKKFIPFILLIIIISSLGIFTFGVEEAKAVDLGIVDGFKTLLGGFLLMIQELIGSLVAWFAGLAQGILNFTNLQNSQMVKDGWEITRGLVNMFFILILMIIALATIFKVESYGMKTLLPKLIIAALLINFSLVFCGAIIDSAGVLTNFFIKDSKNFFENIADEMGLTTIMVGTVQKTAKSKWGCNYAGLPDPIYKNKTVCDAICIASTLGNTCYEVKPPKVDWGDIKGDNFWKVIAALLLSIIFTIIAAFVFAALAFLLLIRVLVIWFLLILAPIAWFFWILPATKNLWEKWWATFIKWVFFAPAAIFFIWLSVNSWLKFIKGKAPLSGGEIIEGMSNVVSNGVLESKIMPQVMAPANFIQFILACGMLIGSLIVAQKIGIYGASGVINIGKSASKGIGKGVGRWTGRKAQRAAYKPADAVGKGLDRASTWARKSKIGRWTGASTLLGKAAGAGRALNEKERAAFGKEEEKYKNQSSDHLKSQFKSIDGRGKAVIAKILASRGDFKSDNALGFTEDDIKKSMTLTKKYGQEKDVVKSRLDLAPIVKNIDPKDADKIKEEINEAVGKVKSGDVGKIQIETIGEPGEKYDNLNKNQKNVFDSFKKQLSVGGKLGKSVLIKAADENPALYNRLMNDIVGKNLEDMKGEIREYYNTTTGKAVTGNKETKKVPFSTA